MAKIISQNAAATCSKFTNSFKTELIYCEFLLPLAGWLLANQSIMKSEFHTLAGHLCFHLAKTH